MISNDLWCVLFIEPEHPASPVPVIDVYTRRMAAALSKAFKGAWTGRGNRADGFEIGNGWKGVCLCVCGCSSGSQDLLLSNGMVTNSLAVHYLAHHRDEVPEEELAKVMQLPDEEADPVLPVPRMAPLNRDPARMRALRPRRGISSEYLDLSMVQTPADLKVKR